MHGRNKLSAGGRRVLVCIKDVHASMSPLCLHLWGMVELTVGCVQLPSAGSAVELIKADNCLETTIY